MRIHFGQKVYCQGGEPAGEAGAAVVDSQSLEVTHIALRNSSLVGQNWLIPLSEVQGTTRDGLLLYANASQLPALPQFVPGLEAEPPVVERSVGAGPTIAQGVPDANRTMQVRRTSVVIGPKCEVVTVDGQLGPLGGVLCDIYTNRLTSIVVGSGMAFNRDVDIPVKWIDDIQAQSIKLATTLQQARDLVGPEAGPYLSAAPRERPSDSVTDIPESPFGAEL